MIEHIDKKILALSWKEPYGSLMLTGKIETRTWSTKYRGLVLICTSQKPYNFGQIFSISGKNQTGRINQFLNHNIINGKAIAIGSLIDCRPMQKFDEDKCFVEYYPDLFCHVYENVIPIIPFDWKGSQGWKELTIEQKMKIIPKQ